MTLSHKDKQVFFKAVNKDGFDHYSHSINYNESIGKTVKPISPSKKYELCSNSVLHACKNPTDLFRYASDIRNT